MKKTLLLAGTKKGLLLFTSTGRKRWQLHGPFVTGKEIHHAVYDERNGRIFATSNDAWFGSQIVWSDNLGKTWKTAKKSPAFAAGSGHDRDNASFESFEVFREKIIQGFHEDHVAVANDRYALSSTTCAD